MILIKLKMSFDWSRETYDNCIHQLYNSRNEDYVASLVALSFREDIISAVLSMPHLDPGYDNQDMLMALVCGEHNVMDIDFVKRAFDQVITHPDVKITQYVLQEMVRNLSLLEDHEVFEHVISSPNRNFRLNPVWLVSFIGNTRNAGYPDLADFLDNKFFTTYYS